MDPATIAAAAQAASTVFSALSGREDRQQSVNLRRLRKEAEKAGFNPVTALKATGGQGFQTLPGISSLEMLSQVAGAGADYFEATDPINRETQELENELLRRQADYYAASAASFGSVPTVSEDSESLTRREKNEAIAEGLTSMSVDLGLGEPKSVPVFNTRNVLVWLTPSEARQANLRAGDKMIVGTQNEITGEIIGEIAAIEQQLPGGDGWDRTKDPNNMPPVSGQSLQDPNLTPHQRRRNINQIRSSR